MKNTVKKTISVVIAISMAFSLVMTSFALATDDTNPGSNDLPSLCDFQELFPQLNLSASGYVGTGVQSRTAAPLALTDTSTPVATYTAEDEDGLYYVNVYADNSYVAYGLTAGGGTSGISSGSTSSDSTYIYHTNRRVYVLLYGSIYTVNYYVSYKTNKSTNLSTFTSLGTAACTAVTTDPSGGTNGASGQSIPSAYARKAETSSAKASAYGGGKMYYYDTYMFTLKLYVDISKGTASVRVVEA